MRMKMRTHCADIPSLMECPLNDEADSATYLRLDWSFLYAEGLCGCSGVPWVIWWVVCYYTSYCATFPVGPCDCIGYGYLFVIKRFTVSGIHLWLAKHGMASWCHFEHHKPETHMISQSRPITQGRDQGCCGGWGRGHGGS